VPEAGEVVVRVKACALNQVGAQPSERSHLYQGLPGPGRGARDITTPYSDVRTWGPPGTTPPFDRPDAPGIAQLLTIALKQTDYQRWQGEYLRARTP